jgi:hypothetical protein
MCSPLYEPNYALVAVEFAESLGCPRKGRICGTLKIEPLKEADENQ